MFEYSSTTYERPSFSETDVLTAEEMCDALKVSMATLNRLNLPTVYLGKRSRRYCWGQILRVLEERAA